MPALNQRTRHALVRVWTAAVLLFVFLPGISILLASLTSNRYFIFPIQSWGLAWWQKTFSSIEVRQLLATSISIALVVTLIAVVIGFFGALAFARYRWKGRKLFQKIILLPILFPQAVLGLCLLLWFTAVGIIPSWQAAIFAHSVWIAPITTLIIAIQVYSFDPAVEEAAFDLGASRWQVLKEVTLPLLAPGIFSGFLSAFLLSWANFPLSMFSTGADQTIPEWISAKVQAGYTPQVPAVGTLTMVGAGVLLGIGYAAMVWLNRRRMGTAAS